ncbi:hypothetical protein [Williamsia muralis]|uniref:hypothetical protein n=1 Tax=Williamsia marianensis TaxID=85044 RepID=UPI001671763B|nr:hypothetical protein [Williamsia marianensis]
MRSATDGRTILSWVNGDPPVERDQLIDDIAAMWLSLGESASDMARSRLDVRPGA